MELDPHTAAVAAQIRVVLDEADVSGAELARRMGVTQSYVARRLLGKTPFAVAELLRIAELLGVPATRLLPATAAPAA